MRLNIHISFWSSSSGLKEDEWLNIPLVKWNCFLSKLIYFLVITFFSTGFIVWFVCFFFLMMVGIFPSLPHSSTPFLAHPSPHLGGVRGWLCSTFVYQTRWFLGNFLGIFSKLLWTLFSCDISGVDNDLF